MVWVDNGCTSVSEKSLSIAALREFCECKLCLNFKDLSFQLINLLYVHYKKSKLLVCFRIIVYCHNINLKAVLTRLFCV